MRKNTHSYLNDMKKIFTALNGVMIDVTKIVSIGNLNSNVNSPDSIFPYHEESWIVPIMFLGSSTIERFQLTDKSGVKYTDIGEVVQEKRNVFRKIAEDEYNRLITMWKES